MMSQSQSQLFHPKHDVCLYASTPRSANRRMTLLCSRVIDTSIDSASPICLGHPCHNDDDEKEDRKMKRKILQPPLHEVRSRKTSAMDSRKVGCDSTFQMEKLDMDQAAQSQTISSRKMSRYLFECHVSLRRGFRSIYAVEKKRTL